MKKLFAVLLMSSMCFALSAQQITMDKLPAAVAGAFKAKFPEAKQQSWEMEKANVYEAAFFNGKKRQTAQFDNTGKWLETETEINYSEVPKAVDRTFAKQFDGFKVQVVNLVETPDKGTLYELEVFKGKENYEVLFSAKGELIKKEAGGQSE